MRSLSTSPSQHAFRIGALSAAVMSIAVMSLVAARADAQQGRQDRRDVTLAVGEQRTVPATDVRTYSPAGNAVDVREDFNATPPRFIIVGARPGSASVLFTMNDGSELLYRITVTATDATEQNGAIGERDNIRLDVYFVQIGDSYNHDIGIAWPSFIGSPENFSLNASIPLVTPPMSPASSALNMVVTNHPLPRLDLLQANGWARIMRQAALVTSNGNQAVFESGGEINVRVSGLQAGALQRIHFGSQFTVLPRYDRQTGRIDLQINAEFSDLTDDRGTGVPGRTVAHVETLVNLNIGQAIVLSGLISESEAQAQAGLPGLSQIPILGVLFGTHVARAERTRNVLFMVPTVVDAVSTNAQERIRDALRMYESFNGGAQNVQLLDPPALPTEEEGGAESGGRGERRGRRPR